MEMTRKGFYFSMDAVVALLIMSASMMLVMQISSNASSDFSTKSQSFQKISSTGRDAMKLASVQDLSSVNSDVRQEVLETKAVNETALDKSILNGISLLWASRNFNAAESLTESYFDAKIPEQYNYAVKISENNTYTIYETEGLSTLEKPPSLVTSTSTLVSGHMIDSSSTGYRARAFLNSVEKNAFKRVFIGGYVGQGLITYNVSLENMQKGNALRNLSMKMDVSSPFNLYINGEEAIQNSQFQPDTGSNLTVEKYQVCPSENVRDQACQALSSGNNNISFEFTGFNQSIRGGVIKINYRKTSDIQARSDRYREKRKRFPGINGVINYYGSFYVPGEVQEMSAKIHYTVDNRTLFVTAGGTKIFSEKVDGTDEVIRLSNSEIRQALPGNLSYSKISRKTVPLRVGLGEIDTGESERTAIADSVSVMDVSGSMEGDKLAEAKNASKLFIDTILNAKGNNAGFVSYSDQVQASHELTDNAQSLKQLIEAQEAGGNTCIGCGILESTDILQGDNIVNAVDQGSEWNYTTEYLGSRPPEVNGDYWTQVGYDANSWNTSQAPITSGQELESFEGNVYFRKEFDLNHSVFSMDLGLYTNDVATVYVNGEVVYNGTVRHLARYWNRNLSLNGSNLKPGKNVLAVKLRNAEDDTQRIRENSQEGWDGNFTNTTVNNGRLQLRPQFGNGQDVEAPQPITGTTSRGGFFSSHETYIDGVSFSSVQEQLVYNGIDYVSGNNGGYLDATSRIAQPLIPGESYRVNMTFHTGQDAFGTSYTDYGTVAFDWDGDGSFADNTAIEVGQCSGNGCRVSRTFRVPDDVDGGSIAVRLMGEEGEYHTDPTSEQSLTEAEDYTLHIDRPEYSNGTYSSMLQASETVNWSSWNADSFVPENSSLKFNFSVADTVYENISQVPNSQNITVKAFLKTFSGNATPTVREISIGYPLDQSTAGFDASLNLTEERKKSMIVMSDGEPNVETSMTDVPNHHEGDGWFGDEIGAADHAIEAACRAQENHGIKVYAVGFGDGANEEVMRQIAECGGGQYYYAASSNLEEVFSAISNRILEASFVGQTVKKGTELSRSRLFADSYLKFNYTEDESSRYGRIKLRRNTQEFGGQVESPKEKTLSIPKGTIRVPEGTDIESARITSYSGNRWTYTVEIDDDNIFETVFKLTNYGRNFPALGDPFTVNIPEDRIRVGENTVRVDTASAPGETQGGSPENRVFYTLTFDNYVGYGGLFPNASAAQKDARKRLRQKLDFNGDGEPIVNMTELEMNPTKLGGQPYLWGPANIKLVIWK